MFREAQCCDSRWGATNTEAFSSSGPSCVLWLYCLRGVKAWVTPWRAEKRGDYSTFHQKFQSIRWNVNQIVLFYFLPASQQRWLTGIRYRIWKWNRLQSTTLTEKCQEYKKMSGNMSKLKQRRRAAFEKDGVSAGEATELLPAAKVGKRSLLGGISIPHHDRKSLPQPQPFKIWSPN